MSRRPPPPRSSPSSRDQAAPLEAPAFYNTSFSMHRISPLYIGAEPLSPKRLGLLCQRLRDILIGDVVRGVQVGLEGDDASLGTAGALEQVTVRWLSVGALLGEHQAPDESVMEDDTMDVEGDMREKKDVLWIEIRYEHALCTAVLTPTFDSEERGNSRNFPSWIADRSQDAGHDGEFLRFPLLLLRMPAPLKTFIIDFLCTTFDCRVSPLRLGTKSLVECWEGWIQDAGLPSKGPLAKDAVITLGFFVSSESDGVAESDALQIQQNEQEPEAEALGIKSIDVIISAPDLRKFLRAGQGIESLATHTRESDPFDRQQRRRLGGSRDNEGWAWRSETLSVGDSTSNRASQPFTEALGRYMRHHLGLDIFHPSVRIAKIASAGFALSEGRIKIFTPPTHDGVFAPTLNLLSRLVDKAGDTALAGQGAKLAADDAAVW